MPALTPLSAADLTDLGRLETVIETGLGTFVAVGRALAEIHLRGLYQATHGRWEDYCAARWGFSRRHADRLMGAASVVADLLAPSTRQDPVGPVVLPESERVVRPLVALPAEQRRDVWQTATRTAPPGQAPTAAHVASLARAAVHDLSAAEQLAAVQGAETQTRARAAGLERPSEEARLIGRLERYLRKGLKLRRALAALASLEPGELLEEGLKLVRQALEAADGS